MSKVTEEKSTRGVAQAVECLLSKCEAVSSNPSIIKRKRRKEEREGGSKGERKREKERKRER
jgi:hypothetical protein